MSREKTHDRFRSGLRGFRPPPEIKLQRVAQSIPRDDSRKYRPRVAGLKPPVRMNISPELPGETMAQCGHPNEELDHAEVLKDGTVWRYYVCPDCQNIRSTADEFE